MAFFDFDFGLELGEGWVVWLVWTKAKVGTGKR
jgi:hypothetical protein